MRFVSAAACLLLSCAVSCSASKSGVPAGCGDGAAVADGCAGVPPAALCGASTCTDGVTCASVATAGSDADLPRVLASALPGACIALAPGTYSAASLPQGISLLGRGAGDVHVAGITIAGASVVRGLEVGAGGISIADGAQRVRIDSVRVTSASGDGVSIGKGAQVTIASSTIADAGAGKHEGGNGVAAFGGGDVTLDHTLVRGAHGPGVWMQAACGDGCTCSDGAMFAAHGVVVEACELVGASLVGVSATLGDVTIDSTASYHLTLSPGGGLAISKCASVTTDGNLTASNNTGYGVLVDHSSATLGGSGDSTLSVTSNQIHGVWIQNVGQKGSAQSVTLTNLVARDNAGVGVGFDGGARAIVIQGRSIIAATTKKNLPAIQGGTTPTSDSLGHGLSWNNGVSKDTAVQARIDGLVLDGSARVDMLVTGAWADGSSGAKLSIGKGDPHGIVIQGFVGDGLMPGMESVSPDLVSKTSSFDFPVAVAPATPQAVITK